MRRLSSGAEVGVGRTVWPEVTHVVYEALILEECSSVMSGWVWRKRRRHEAVSSWFRNDYTATPLVFVVRHSTHEYRRR
jgi:hypothetical protein